MESKPPEVEYPFDIMDNYQALHQSTTGYGVFNPIGHRRLSISFGKGVLMSPEPVGASDLFVDELKWRLPNGNFGSPSQGNTSPMKSVVDNRTLGNGDWSRRQDLEGEPGWSDPFEIMNVGKEWKKLFCRDRKCLGGFKYKCPHGYFESDGRLEISSATRAMLRTIAEKIKR